MDLTSLGTLTWLASLLTALTWSRSGWCPLPALPAWDVTASAPGGSAAMCSPADRGGGSVVRLPGRGDGSRGPPPPCPHPFVHPHCILLGRCWAQRCACFGHGISLGRRDLRGVHVHSTVDLFVLDASAKVAHERFVGWLGTVLIAAEEPADILWICLQDFAR